MSKAIAEVAENEITLLRMLVRNELPPKVMQKLEFKFDDAITAIYHAQAKKEDK